MLLGDLMRIVSLLPSATEIVGALDLGDMLVGISHECDFPSNITHLPQLTSSILKHGLSPKEIDDAVRRATFEGRPIYAVDGALLSALKPDLILTQGVCAVCAVTEQTVEASVSLLTPDQVCSAPVLSLEAHDIEGIITDVQTVANAAGVPERAARVAADMRTRIGPWHTPGTRRVAVLEWPDPLWYAGHWVPEMLAAAGGFDVKGQPGAQSGRLTEDELIALDPEVIVMGSCGYGLEKNLAFASAFAASPLRAKLRSLDAVWAMDANSFLSRPAPRVARGVEVLRAILHGGTAPSPHEAIRVPSSPPA